MDKLAINGGKPVRDNFLIFGSPLIGKEEINEVVATLKSGWIGTGPRVSKFEKNFKEYIGSKHAIALNSCTAALHLAMVSSGIGEGDEVITTPLTFCATANSILHAGAKPIFADVNIETMNIDPSAIKKAITPRTKAILLVHFAGRPCDMDTILPIANKNNLLIIEDAAHCIEGWYKGKKIGNIGDVSCFSFYATKNLVTGEGGMVTTNEENLADKIRMYGLHGMSRDAWKRYSDDGFKHYQVVFPGFKYNMMDIQAAMGIHQLDRIDQSLKRRNEIWVKYDNAFSQLPLITPKNEERDTVHARHLYSILLNLEELTASRDTILNALHQENIGTGIHFISLHMHEFYKNTFGFVKEDFPNAAFISERTLSLPLSAKLSDQDVEDVINAVSKVLAFYKK